MAKRPETATCSTCCYWDVGEDKDIGMCRRDPPAIFDDGESLWPNTGPTDWCGHYNDDWENTDSPKKGDKHAEIAA